MQNSLAQEKPLFVEQFPQALRKEQDPGCKRPSTQFLAPRASLYFGERKELLAAQIGLYFTWEEEKSYQGQSVLQYLHRVGTIFNHTAISQIKQSMYLQHTYIWLFNPSTPPLLCAEGDPGAHLPVVRQAAAPSLPPSEPSAGVLAALLPTPLHLWTPHLNLHQVLVNLFLALAKLAMYLTRKEDLWGLWGCFPVPC